MFKSFPNYRQLDGMDCGPTCLRIIAKHYGKTYSLQNLREKSYFTRQGVSLLGISDAAEAIGFRTLATKVDFAKLKEEAPTPFIAHWRQRHFVVVYQFNKRSVLVSDPAHGLVKLSNKEFLDGWIGASNRSEEVGIALLLTPSPEFYKAEDEKINRAGFAFLFSYLTPYRKFIVQLLVGMVVGSLLQLILPFLTQSIVDVGIEHQDLNFVTLILIAQIVFFFGRTSVELIRNWILLHLGTRINISLLSDFLIKLMKLPIAFFDTKMIGDLIQRTNDHTRIENFLTSTTLEVLFSLVNLIIFGIVLGIYNLQILLVFIVGSVAYMMWILIFMKKRRDIDYKRFDQMAQNQSNLIQLITGMQEIKLNNSEKQMRWEWERIQAKIFKVSIKGLALNQYQVAGSTFINELKNIIIAFLAARAVIEGQITLGMMLAIQYIIGQLNAPINQLAGFIHSAQDAKISLERLGEIHNQNNEEGEGEDKVTIFPEDKSLTLRDISFQYSGPHSEYALKNVSLYIPEGKVTAIVGASGSGKTTLVKLLLKFYEPGSGNINVGEISLKNFSNKLWRDQCGAVLQDGFIFSDNIAKNIAVSEENIDKEKLLYAVKIANIQEFIESLPLGYNTKIGSNGHGLSQGQRQRILIARAVYKNPAYIYFDEATNALDANNEKVIMENMEKFFKGRTVVVVAHRLSTVRNADQIIVLDKGKVTETGTHNELTERRGDYYRLVKNQLELGN